MTEKCIVRLRMGAAKIRILHAMLRENATYRTLSGGSLSLDIAKVQSMRRSTDQLTSGNLLAS